MGRVDQDGREHYDVALTPQRANRLRELADAAGVESRELLAFVVNSALDGETDRGD